MATEVDTIFVGADFDVDYALARTRAGTYLNSGTCTYTLVDSDASSLDSGTLSYVSGSNGKYTGVIASTVTAALTIDALYTLTITFNQGDYDDRRVFTLTAKQRGRR